MGVRAGSSGRDALLRVSTDFDVTDLEVRDDTRDVRARSRHVQDGIRAPLARSFLSTRIG